MLRTPGTLESELDNGFLRRGILRFYFQMLVCYAVNSSSVGSGSNCQVLSGWPFAEIKERE